jgi:hypothetical protein
MWGAVGGQSTSSTENVDRRSHVPSIQCSVFRANGMADSVSSSEIQKPMVLAGCSALDGWSRVRKERRFGKRAVSICSSSRSVGQRLCSVRGVPGTTVMGCGWWCRTRSGCCVAVRCVSVRSGGTGQSRARQDAGCTSRWAESCSAVRWRERRRSLPGLQNEPVTVSAWVVALQQRLHWTPGCASGLGEDGAKTDRRRKWRGRLAFKLSVSLSASSLD